MTGKLTNDDLSDVQKQVPLKFRGCVDPDMSYDIIDADGDRILCDNDSGLTVPDARMASYIVHCVNNHQALIDALENTIDYIGVQALYMGDFTWIPTVEYEQAIEIAEAALKAARG